jgi:hypothetical protein
MPAVAQMVTGVVEWNSGGITVAAYVKSCAQYEVVC